MHTDRPWFVNVKQPHTNKESWLGGSSSCGDGKISKKHIVRKASPVSCGIEYISVALSSKNRGFSTCANHFAVVCGIEASSRCVRGYPSPWKMPNTRGNLRK